MPMSPNLKVRYEFDPTASNPDNLVSNETVITDQRLMKVVVPKHFLFYTKSVVIRDVQTGETLTPADYRFDDVSEIVAMNTGHSAAATILITKDTHSTVFELSYQVVGGWYSHPDYNDIIRRLEDLKKSDKPINWKDILGKPDTYPPAAHLHPIWQTFGYGHLIYILERVEQAILLGDHVEMNLLWKRLKDIESSRSIAISNLSNQVTNFVTTINGSIGDLSNRLDEVSNGLNDKVGSLKDKLEEHLRADNPHNITVDTIGTLSSDAINQLINEVNISITNLRDSTYTREEVTSIINEVNGRITELDNGKLGKEEKAADTAKFDGKDIEAFKDLIAETAHERNKNNYVGNTYHYPVNLSVGDYGNVMLKREIPVGEVTEPTLGELAMFRPLTHFGNHHVEGNHGFYSYDESTDRPNGYPVAVANGFPADLVNEGIDSATIHSLPNGKNTIQFMYPSPTRTANSLPVFNHYTRYYDSVNKQWTPWVKSENFRNHMSNAYNLDDETKLATSKSVSNLNDIKQNVIRNELVLSGTDAEERNLKFVSSEQSTYWKLGHDATDFYLSRVDRESELPVLKLKVPRGNGTKENPNNDTLALKSEVDRKLDNYGTTEHRGAIDFTGTFTSRMMFGTGKGKWTFVTPYTDVDTGNAYTGASEFASSKYPWMRFQHDEGGKSRHLYFPAVPHLEVVAYRKWVSEEIWKIAKYVDDMLFLNGLKRHRGDNGPNIGDVFKPSSGSTAIPTNPSHGATTTPPPSRPPHLLGSG